jgi:hypothetical protein
LHEAFAISCDPLSAELHHRLRTAQLDARYSNLMLLLEPPSEGRADDAVHWRLDPDPLDQFERAFVVLPGGIRDLDEDGRRSVFVRLLADVLDELTPLRGWPANTSQRLTDGLAPDVDAAREVAIVQDPFPPLFIHVFDPNECPRDRRTSPYRDRHRELAEQFHDDDWWSWWLSTNRKEIDLYLDFGGTASLQVRASEDRISIRRGRARASMPQESDAARALAVDDMLEAVDRLQRRLGLPPHPRLS